MANTKKKTAGAATPNGQSKNNSTQIIAEPIEIVNMSPDEIVAAAIDRLKKEDKAASYDRYGVVMHTAVCEALSDFCRQNAEFAQAICQSDKHFGDCMKAVAKNAGSALSDLDAYTRAVQFYFSTASISFKMLIDVGDGILNETPSEPPKPPLEVSLDNLLDW